MFPSSTRCPATTAVFLLVLVLSACRTALPPPAEPAAGVEIHVAHINDHHSNLDAHANFELVIDGTPTRVSAGGFPRLTALFRETSGQPNTIRLHAGDAMTGTLYHTLYKGEADAALMNTVCFDAFELGNHEFDEGDAGLRVFLDHLKRGPCQTTVVAANVQPAIGSPLAPRAGDDYLKPYLLKPVGGTTFAVIGIEVRDKTMNSSRPLPTTAFADEVATAQRMTDEVRAQGVRHIILLTHHGYDADQAMAAQLSDVDVIIGGDSHSLLGGFPAVGITASSGPYPTIVRNRDGDPVCIGQAWEYAKVFARMKVRFDDQARVVDCSGEVILPIGDDFRRQDATGEFVAVDAATRSRILDRLNHQTGVRVVEADPLAAGELARFSSKLDKLKQQRIGSASEALCLVRVPGESTNRSSGIAGCERANTLAHGSDVAQAVAEAYRQASRLADVALLNSGGVRTGVPAGEITFNTANTVLPYTNVLYELRLTGAQLVEAIDDGVANHLDYGRSDGSHPYAAGLRWHLDMSRPRGSRFSQVEVKVKGSELWQPIDPQKTYTLVTSDYLATGSDGYATLARINAAGQSVNTYLLYTQTFVDYLQAHGTLTRPGTGDYSHQSVITRDGTRLP
ncbi:bifunctional UDP-sugar hydrolase/5'-nucleotidase [Accumulibacter sp.]|uniref:bifunctional metallophosphatase/5'-nucleotidase n=1 Tax=Accumulibacter sp. TaxID=2053492 RepID=UPI0025F26DFF|nr:5'-nucleotidase C-terminal domain-containing protein [Accumulibacter sp.]MCM8596030.1 5'-nucleotidase C-terminal domain-containing protein [Accumulibacter sp.]MDS4050179.1 5'-nucleotidase C-terminal domain-containing protein [Accumulibacter sp.]